MKYRVTHLTTYHYPVPVTQCHNLAHLIPRNTEHQICEQTRLEIEPEPVDIGEHHDFFGNHICYFAIQQPHERLVVTATSELTVAAPQPPPANCAGMTWEAAAEWLGSTSNSDAIENRQYVFDSPLVQYSPDLRRFASPSFTRHRPLIEAIFDLMDRIHTDFNYDPGFTSVHTPLSEVLQHRRGVCQDFAHLGIACLRAMGMAARYVSGYLETLPPPGQPRLTGVDASHAWLSVYIPEFGWLDLDPTNNQIPSQQYITTAWGRDFSDVAPLKGVIYGGGTQHQLGVSVDVQRLEG